MARVTRMLEREGTRFAEIWFTPGERHYCEGKAYPARHFAARIAAKEAVLKSLAITWRGPVPWAMIEIVSKGGSPPKVILTRELARIAASRAVDLRISMSHSDDFAVATAIAVPAPQRPRRRHRSAGSAAPRRRTSRRVT